MDFDETWASIEGFAGYEISTRGRVRSWRPMGAGGPVNAPRPLKPRVHSGGYLRVTLARDLKYFDRYIHRLVAEAFIGAGAPGMQVAHANGNKADNRLENLRWATPQENNADKIAHGTVTRGERNPAARLSNADVLKIRASKLGNGDLAAIYNVTSSHIWQIRTGRRWST